MAVDVDAGRVAKQIAGVVRNRECFVVLLLGLTLLPAPDPVAAADDLASILIDSPAAGYRPDARLTGVLNQEMMARAGISAPELSEGVRGRVKTWRSQATGDVIVARVLAYPSQFRARAFQRGALASGTAQSVETFSIAEVSEAKGFILAGGPGATVVAYAVFRRGTLVFLLEASGSEPPVDLIRRLAARQDARVPPAPGNPITDWERAARLIGWTLYVLLFYVLAVEGAGSLADRAAHLRARLGHRRASFVAQDIGEPGRIAAPHPALPPEEAGKPGVTRDVSAVVRVRRKIARAGLAGKVFGAGLCLFALYPALWPRSLPVLGVGLGIFWIAVRAQRGFRGAAASLLFVLVVWVSIQALAAFNLVDQELATGPILALASALALVSLVVPVVLIVPGAVAVLRSDEARRVAASRQREPKKSRYRRVFTGRRTARVAVLLTLSLTVMVLGGFALVVGAGSEGLPEEFVVVLTLPVSLLLYRRARRLAALTASQLRSRDGRAEVLYLRSFEDDPIKIRTRVSARQSWLEAFGHRRRERFEEIVAWQLWRYGPVIAVSEPGESLAPIGAAREQLPNATWQREVVKRMTGARLIVLVLGRTAGVAWEIEKLTQLSFWSKTMLVFPPVGARELSIRWQEFCNLLERGGLGRLALPVEPWLVFTAVVNPAEGITAYTGAGRDEWTYEVALEQAVTHV